MKLFEKLKEKQNKVENIELSVNRPWLRLAIVIGFLLIGLAAIGIGLFDLLGEDSGWRTVEMAESFPEIEEQFIFSYCLGSGNEAPAAEYKIVSGLYYEIGSKAYKLFDDYGQYEGITNLASVSASPNSEIQVDPLLYDALKLAAEEGGNLLYLAPVYREYEALCLTGQEQYAMLRDPYKNADAAAYISETMAFASDRDAVNLELLGDNRVKLFVSHEYIAFAEENEIDSYISFGWLENAFVIDAIADYMTEKGYTKGNITSYDGFTRNLDGSGEAYSYNVFNRRDNVIYPAAAVNYSGSAAFVTFRDYPMSNKDNIRYFSYSDGNVATPYADPIDGFYKNGMGDLMVASKEMGCSEIALKAYSCFLDEKPDVSALSGLLQEGVASVWCESDTVFWNSDSFPAVNSYSEGELSYKTQKQQ